MNVKSGDIIEWTYSDGTPVPDYGGIWSNLESKWVPVGSMLTHLLISRENGILVWLNELGLFHAFDSDGGGNYIPRARR
jgi:hypothetical protein